MSLCLAWLGLPSGVIQWLEIYQQPIQTAIWNFWKYSYMSKHTNTSGQTWLFIPHTYTQTHTHTHTHCLQGTTSAGKAREWVRSPHPPSLSYFNSENMEKWLFLRLTVKILWKLAFLSQVVEKENKVFNLILFWSKSKWN